jgi:hypothetical protein
VPVLELSVAEPEPKLLLPQRVGAGSDWCITRVVCEYFIGRNADFADFLKTIIVILLTVSFFSSYTGTGNKLLKHLIT